MNLNPIYEIINLKKCYGKNVVFDNLNFKIYAGECILIQGPNGAGKTTLLNILAKFDTQYEGKVYFKSNDLRKVKFSSYPVSFLPDEFLFYEGLTVREHLNLVAMVYGYDKKQAKDMIDSICSLLKLKEYFNYIPFALSKGNKQKLMIACSLLKTFEVFMADEPFNNLDHQTVLNLCEILKILKQNNKTIILVSHEKIQEMKDIIENIIVLS